MTSGIHGTAAESVQRAAKTVIADPLPHRKIVLNVWKHNANLYSSKGLGG